MQGNYCDQSENNRNRSTPRLAATDRWGLRRGPVAFRPRLGGWGSPRCCNFALIDRLPVFEPELFHLLVERRAVHAEGVGRGITVPAVGLQNVENDLPFGLFESLFERHVADARDAEAGAAGDFAGEIAEADHFTLAQQHGPFHDVLQLANVAGPGVALQRRERFFAEAVDGAIGIVA